MAHINHKHHGSDAQLRLAHGNLLPPTRKNFGPNSASMTSKRQAKYSQIVDIQPRKTMTASGHTRQPTAMLSPGSSRSVHRLMVVSPGPNESRCQTPAASPRPPRPPTKVFLGSQSHQPRSPLRQANNIRIPSVGLGDRKRSDMVSGKLRLENGEKEFSQPPEPQDCGTIAWLHAVACFIVTFNCWGLNAAFGAFQAHYAFDMLPGTSLERISWVGSIQLSLMFFLGMPVGLAMEYGLFRFLFHGGTFLLVGSVLLTGFCSSWWELLLVQGVCTGLAMGLVFCSEAVLLMRHLNNVGLVTTLCATGSGLGAICYSTTFRYSMYHIGFFRTMEAFAFITLVTMAIANVVVQPRRETLQRRSSLHLGPLKDFPYWVMTVGLFCTFIGLFFAPVYIVSFAIQVTNVAAPEAMNLLIVMCAANFAGRVAIGFISAHYTGPLNMLVPSCALSALFIYTWIAVHSQPSLFVVAVFYGLFSGGIEVQLAATIHLFSDSDSGSNTLKTGVAFTVIGIACLTGTPISGLLISVKHGGFLYAQVFAGSCLMLGALVLSLARSLKLRQVGNA